MVKVRVPATSANLGPGFDCMGMALEIYNTVEAQIIPDGLEIINHGRDMDLIETDDNNLIYRAMKKAFDLLDFQPSGIRITAYNQIPVARGLGSSAASTAAGLILGNQLSGNKLDIDTLIELGTQMEGHPDNIVPAILGGMTISYLQDDTKVRYVQMGFPEKLRLVLMVPNHILSTKAAREVLPESVELKDAVFNVSRAALMVASLMSKELEHLRFAVQDKLHQPYREKLIPGMKDIFEESYKSGAKAVFLSGAGSTLIALIDENNYSFMDKINDSLTKQTLKWELNCVNVSKQGAACII